MALLWMRPEWEHAARWCPNGSSGSWQPEHVDSVRNRGNRNRSRNSTWNKHGWMVNSGVVGAWGPEMCVWALGLSCETPVAPPDRAAGARTRQPESPNVHISGFRSSKTPTKFNEKTQERERRMKIVVGGGKKKSEILGGPAEGCPVQGCPAEVVQRRVVQRRVVQRRVVQRQWGAGFRVSGSVHIFRDKNRNRTTTK